MHLSTQQATTTIEINTLKDFLNEFKKQQISSIRSGDPHITYTVSPNLIARICKGRHDQPEELEYLTDCSTDRTCFFMGSDGIARLLQIGARNPIAMLQAIGFEHKYIEEKLERGFVFDLLVIESDDGHGSESEHSYPATWNGAFSMIKALFPDVYEIIHHYEELMIQRDSFEYYSQHFPFFEVRAQGKHNNHRYLNYSRFKEMFLSDDSELKKPTELDARKFMYYEMGMRDLFKGDGYTYQENGERGLKEYLLQNKKRCELQSDHCFLRLDFPK